MLTINKRMSSREIAELTGKRHDNVVRDICTLNESYGNLSLLKIEEGYYLHPSTGTQRHREFLLSRMQTFDLMTGYNTELRIKVNRRWEELETRNMIDFSDPTTVLQLAQNWNDEHIKRVEAEKRIKVLEPKAVLMERVLDDNKMIDIGQAAKILRLGFGRNTLFEKLRKGGIFFTGRNEPKQIYIDKGYFRLAEKMIERENNNGFVVLKVLVTQRGLEFLSNTFKVAMPHNQLAVIN
jgi:anti-repressor protein